MDNVPIPLTPEAELHHSDLAAEFVEDELGRHDWSHNWLKVREGDAKARVQRWLDFYAYEANADEIMRILDGMVEKFKDSKWK